MELGSILEGKYKILDQLGKGGMSSVYLAENVRLGSLWAVKEIRKQAGETLDLYVEPNILKRLDHPALQHVIDIVEDEASIYIIVDYIEGTPLDKVIGERGRIPEGLAIEWAKQLCDVLLYLHSTKPNPVIYRDMKPANIILTASGRLKLIDFGIAREYKSRSPGDTVFIGTRGYAAPEQYGGGQTGLASDIYSLGVTMHHLLSGIAPNAAPFELKPLRRLNPDLSTEIERIVAKCTRQDPKERYVSAAELLNDLKLLTCGGAGKSRENPAAAPGGPCDRTFRKLIITVWNNAEFGCELAYTAAKASAWSVFLLDLDLLDPKADLILNTGKFCERYSVNSNYRYSVLDILMDAMDSGSFTPELLYEVSIKRPELKNLYVATGSYQLENYEYFRDEHLVRLLEKAYQSFDITIVLVNKSIYDSFTIISLIKSDFNIAVTRAEPVELREFNRYLAFLREKQNIPAEKTKFVFFEYDNGLNLGSGLLNEITGGNAIGTVRYSRRRIRYRNIKAVYARRMEKEVLADYKRLLAFFNITPKLSLLTRLALLTGRFNQPAIR